MEQLRLIELPPVEPGWVYIGARNGFIKIGYSADPIRRARELGITLLTTMPGSVEDERRLHRRFAADRIDREWFMSSPAILGHVAGSAFVGSSIAA